MGRFSFVNMSHQCLMTKFGYYSRLFVKFYMSATIGDAQNRKQNLTNAKKTLLSLTRAYRLSRYCSCVNTPPLSRLVQFDSLRLIGHFQLNPIPLPILIMNKIIYFVGSFSKLYSQSLFSAYTSCIYCH